MFTGLIRELAKVQDFSNDFLRLKAKYNPGIGDSVAVNGACLTVVKAGNGNFTVELSPESKSVLAVENYVNEVHIEPAMKMSDRLEGHIVQGHVDTIGKIEKIEKKENSFNLYISMPKEYIKFVIPKGSITIDGVSLTVNNVYEKSFRLTIIPHTMQNTLFKRYKIGTRVNIETDMFARYLHHMFKKEKTLDWDSVDKMMASY